jgi:hypothetical protein
VVARVLIDIVLAVEKSNYIDVYTVEKVVEGFASEARKTEEARVGLVVYASQALPILDLTHDVDRIPGAYRDAPLLPGPPNPVPALREAAEMLDDYKDPLTTRSSTLVVWSAKSRPRPSLRLASMQHWSMGFSIAVLLPLQKTPMWIKKYFGESARVYLLRRTANPYRLGARLAREILYFD